MTASMAWTFTKLLDRPVHSARDVFGAILDQPLALIYLTFVNEGYEMIRYPMLTSLTGSTTLAGSAMGRQMLAKLIETTKPVAQPTLAFLDSAEVRSEEQTSELQSL